MQASIDRRHFLAACSSHGLAGTLLPGALYALLRGGEPLSVETIACAEQIAGLDFTHQERELLVEALTEQVEDYARLRALDLPSSVPPSLVFDPRMGGVHPGVAAATLTWGKRPVKYRSAAATGVPMGTGRLEGGEQVGLPDPAHSALGSYAALCLSACRAFCQ